MYENSTKIGNALVLVFADVNNNFGKVHESKLDPFKYLPTLWLSVSLSTCPVLFFFLFRRRQHQVELFGGGGNC